MDAKNYSGMPVGCEARLTMAPVGVLNTDD
jgi:hypothetical protein